jgi:hypothetical protein
VDENDEVNLDDFYEKAKLSSDNLAKNINDYFKKIENEHLMLPIYSKNGGEYHFDIMITKPEGYYLVFININSRKAYAYNIPNKNSSSVKAAFGEFFKDISGEGKRVDILKSDQDSAFLSNTIIDYLLEKDIEYYTTTDNDHNILGIINRFMRTLRDLNEKHKFTPERMQKLLDEYNSSPHKSLGGVSPNEFSGITEAKYIAEKEADTEEIKAKINLEPGDRVRIVLEKNAIAKNRSNLSPEAYIVDSKDGNGYLVRSKDGSIDKYPAYRLVKCDSRYSIAETIKDGKRGIIEKILDYDSRKDKYKVVYDEGTEDWIASKNFRESSPLRLSAMEQKYWADKQLPDKLTKFTPR